MSHCPSRSKGQGVNGSGKAKAGAKAKRSQLPRAVRSALRKWGQVTIFKPESGRTRLEHGEASPTAGGSRQPVVVLFPRVTRV